MKYQELYDMVMKEGFVVVQVSGNVIPQSGYGIVVLDLNNLDYRWMTFPVLDTEAFDTGVKRLTHNLPDGADHIIVETIGDWIYLEGMVVFKDRQYAMGYAHGSGQHSILDIANRKNIERKNKK